jgi:hypothetical protein
MLPQWLQLGVRFGFQFLALGTVGSLSGGHGTNAMRLSMVTSPRTCVLGKSHAGAMFLPNV